MSASPTLEFFRYNGADTRFIVRKNGVFTIFMHVWGSGHPPEGSVRAVKLPLDSLDGSSQINRNVTIARRLGARLGHTRLAFMQVTGPIYTHKTKHEHCLWVRNGSKYLITRPIRTFGDPPLRENAVCVVWVAPGDSVDEKFWMQVDEAPDWVTPHLH